jgi:hypothetical protein
MSGTRWTGKPLLGNVRLVDPKIISGAQEWLIRKQKADGSWMEIDGLFEGWHGGCPLGAPLQVARRRGTRDFNHSTPMPAPHSPL